MDNISFIKNNFQNNPFIMKTLLSKNDIDTVDLFVLKHIKIIIQTYTNKLKFIQPPYHNYKTIDHLYRVLLDITNSELKNYNFSLLSEQEKELYLEHKKIEFVKKNNVLMIYPKTFEETQLVGTNNWCITRNKREWRSYNKGKEHCIISKGKELYGLSYSKDSFYCFDINNQSVSLNTFKNKFSNLKPYFSHIHDHNNTDFNIDDYYMILLGSIIISFFCIMLIIIEGVEQYRSKSPQIKAATLTNQGAQIETAMVFFRVEEGKVAFDSMIKNSDTWEKQLVNNGYLEKMPIPESDSFKIDDSQNFIYSTGVSSDVCKAFENHIKASTNHSDVDTALATDAEDVSGCIDTSEQTTLDDNIFFYRSHFLS